MVMLVIGVTMRVDMAVLAVIVSVGVNQRLLALNRTSDWHRPQKSSQIPSSKRDQHHANR